MFIIGLIFVQASNTNKD